jgi:parvulin-like peptidyl-prolyl isomerase
MALVAREMSEAPSKGAGGLVGPKEWPSVDPGVRLALSATPGGRVTSPVRMPDGYCLIRLEEDRPPVSASFHDNHDAIVQRLREERERLLVEALLARLRSSAVLQWKRADLKTIYERRPGYR